MQPSFQPKPARSSRSLSPGINSSTLTKSTGKVSATVLTTSFRSRSISVSGQRPLAKLRERFLLLGAAAQFLLQLDPLGDLVADAEHANRHAVL